MKHFLAIVFLFTGFNASSQDITGIWRGQFLGKQNKQMELLGLEDRYKFELQIEQNAAAFEGVTYSYKTTIFYGKATCRGTVNKKNGNVFLEELKLVELKMLSGSNACVMTCKMQYTRNGAEEFLEGTYTSYNEADSVNCGGGTIFLRRVATSDFYKEPFLIARENKAKKPTPKTGAVAKTPPVSSSAPPKKPVAGTTKPPASKSTSAKPPVATGKPPVKKPAPTTKPSTVVKKPAPATKPATIAKKPVEKPSSPTMSQVIPKATQDDIAPPPAKKPLNLPKVLATRENELVKTIYVSAGTISVNIYDNGSVDNDTISVYLDKKLVLSKKRLTEQPLKLNFQLDETDSEHELIMVAENLGEIPPNTSLMVVTAGDAKYEVRITSTEQKNAAVVFRLKR